MADSNNWQASLSEHRTAWIVACCSIAIIFLASTWPGLFSFKSTPPASANRQMEDQPRAQQKTLFATTKRQASRKIEKQPQQTPRAKKVSAAAIKIKKPKFGKRNQAPTSEIQSKKTAAVSDNYYVQTGAFKEKLRAQKLIRMLKEHGWNAIIVTKSGFHAVWAGPRNSYGGIQNLQKSIYHTLKIKGFIVQKKSS
jgi:cell division septation protein DedD